MSMVCAISQQEPEEPVVSPSSGCIFEKRLIKKYLIEYGKDPLTKEPLDENQLIEIRQTSKQVSPKLPSANSIPSILGQLRDEWDACMLDNFKLKEDYMETRQQLSLTLYREESAYRVISRLDAKIKELEKQLNQQIVRETNESNNEHE